MSFLEQNEKTWREQLLELAKELNVTIKELKQILIEEIHVSEAAIYSWLRTGKTSRCPKPWIQKLIIDKIKGAKK